MNAVFICNFSIHSFIHSFRPFLWRPFKSFTTQRRSRIQQGYCIGVSRRSAQATAGKGLAQGPYVAARARVEPTTLRLKGIVSTKAPPRPTILNPYAVKGICNCKPKHHLSLELKTFITVAYDAVKTYHNSITMQHTCTKILATLTKQTGLQNCRSKRNIVNRCFSLLI